MVKKELYINLLIKFFQEMGYVELEKEVFYFGVIFDGIFLYYMNMQEVYLLDMMKDMVFQWY